MDYKAHPEYRGHEEVVFANDEATGLKAIIAIHSTVLGPAVGGCRVWTYASEEEALGDVLRLSRGMTFKNSIAGLDLGGGKAVIMLQPGQQKTEALMKAFGRAVDSVQGRYYTAEDVGVSTADMVAVRTETQYVAGLPDGKFASGDPSPITARGVYNGIKVACEHVLGSADLSGVKVAVQGVGHVGWYLCEMLHQSGVRLIVSDVNSSRVEQAAVQFGAEIGPLDHFHAVDCDVYAPCALGGTLSETTIPQIKASIVAGAANNQLRHEQDGALLVEKGITYMPDFLINAGGILNVATEIRQIADANWVDRQLGVLVKRMHEVLAEAEERKVSPHNVALEIAQRRIDAARTVMA